MKKEQKRKILFYGILAGALLLFAACGGPSDTVRSV